MYFIWLMAVQLSLISAARLYLCKSYLLYSNTEIKTLLVVELFINI